MINQYLSRDELAALVECLPTSRACMRRWLQRNGWPFETDRNGFPKVLRAYYDQRLTGKSPAAPAAGATEPNYAIFGKAS